MFAIKNVTLYTITDGVRVGNILVDDDGRISDIGDIAIPEGIDVIDGTGKVLMPGMIDAHGHAGVYEEAIGWEGADGNEAVDPITPQLRALDALNPHDEGIREALQAGITTMCVLPGSANVIGGQGVIIHMHGNTVDEMVIGEGGLKVAFGENPKRVYSGQKKSPSTRMATAALLREQLVKAANYIAKQEKAASDPDKAPERDLKLEAIARVLRGEIPLRAHAHRADDIVTALRIAEEFGIDIVIEHCTEGHKIAEELGQRKAKAVIGPTMTNRSKVEVRERTYTTLKTLWEQGVEIAITMDHPVIHVQYLNISTALAVKAGLPKEEALKAVTINPARILGIADRYGSLEKGKMADLVLWSGDPLDIMSSVEQVFIHGKRVYQA